MTLLAAFKTLIHKYTGFNDIVIGTPTAGRQELETEELIGFFLNTLVLRTDLSDEPDFTEILRRVKETCLNAYKNQNVTFENLIKMLNPERDRSRTPLVQIMFNMLNFDEPKIELENLTIEGLAPEDHWSKFDLTLYTSEKEDKIFLNLVYNVDLYSSQTIKRILSHYENLLKAITADQKADLSKVNVFSENELTELYKQNQPMAVANYQRFEDVKYEDSLDGQFTKQANSNPQAIALKTSERSLTYETLDLHSTKIAEKINSLKTNLQNESIALLFGHDTLMVEAMFGALKANGFYVPLDSNNPANRLIEIIKDADSRILLTGNKFFELAEKLKFEIGEQIQGFDLQIINIEDLTGGEIVNSKLIENSPDSFAYILYTSGSTGIPKGVFQNHGKVLNHILTYTKALNIERNDRILLLASYGFDASVMDIYGALLNGAGLYLYDVRNNGIAGLADFIVKNKITVFHSTPTIFRTFTNELNPETHFSNVKAVVLGGEETFRSDLEIFNRYFPEQAIFVNGLGTDRINFSIAIFYQKRNDLKSSNRSRRLSGQRNEYLFAQQRRARNRNLGNG